MERGGEKFGEGKVGLWAAMGGVMVRQIGRDGVK